MQPPRDRKTERLRSGAPDWALVLAVNRDELRLFALAPLLRGEQLFCYGDVGVALAWRCWRTIAFRIVRNFRMEAVRASIFGFPAAKRRA